MSFYDKFFINLDRSIHRRTYTENILKNIQIPNKRISAVDGSKLDYLTKSDNTSLFYSLFGPNNAIAIAMSHMKAWEKILQSNEN